MLDLSLDASDNAITYFYTPAVNYFLSGDAPGTEARVRSRPSARRASSTGSTWTPGTQSADDARRRRSSSTSSTGASSTGSSTTRSTAGDPELRPRLHGDRAVVPGRARGPDLRRRRHVQRRADRPGVLLHRAPQPDQHVRARRGGRLASRRHQPADLRVPDDERRLRPVAVAGLGVHPCLGRPVDVRGRRGHVPDEVLGHPAQQPRGLGPDRRRRQGPPTRARPHAHLERVDGHGRPHRRHVRRRAAGQPERARRPRRHPLPASTARTPRTTRRGRRRTRSPRSTPRTTRSSATRSSAAPTRRSSTRTSRRRSTWSTRVAGTDTQTHTYTYGGTPGYALADSVLYATGGAGDTSTYSSYRGFQTVASTNGQREDVVPQADYLYGDFDGDGITDLFTADASGQWKYSSAGSGPWTNLRSAPGIPLSDLRIGDFNGDGIADVFTSTPGVPPVVGGTPPEASETGSTPPATPPRPSRTCASGTSTATARPTSSAREIDGYRSGGTRREGSADTSTERGDAQRVVSTTCGSATSTATGRRTSSTRVRPVNWVYSSGAVGGCVYSRDRATSPLRPAGHGFRRLRRRRLDRRAGRRIRPEPGSTTRRRGRRG